MTNRFMAGVAACAIGALAAAPCSAAMFYGVRLNGGLVRFDTSAQTVTTLPNIQAGPTTPGAFEDLEFDGAGTLYAVRGFNDGNFPPTNFNEVYRVTNPATGSALLSATLSNATARRHANLAYRPSSGQFYSNRNSDGHLGTLNVTTGAFADVANVFNGVRSYLEALAVSPTTGQAFGIVDLGDGVFNPTNFALVRMNLDTGVATLVGSLGQGTSPFKALRFDDTGTAYTVNYTNGNVYTVNLSTGAASFLFAGGAAAVNTTGLALIVPGPSGVGLLVLAAAAGGARRRRNAR